MHMDGCATSALDTVTAIAGFANLVRMTTAPNVLASLGHSSATTTTTDR